MVVVISLSTYFSFLFLTMISGLSALMVSVYLHIPENDYHFYYHYHKSYKAKGYLAMRYGLFGHRLFVQGWGSELRVIPYA